MEPEVHMEASQRVHQNELKAYGYEPEEEERYLTLFSRHVFFEWGSEGELTLAYPIDTKT